MAHSISKCNTQFYSSLPVRSGVISKLLNDEENFRHVPENWVVVTTDLRNSTKTIAEGDHQLVNLIATGSIIASLNIAYDAGIEIPFFFGGDGATLLVPDGIASKVFSALKQYQKNVRETHELDLRVGSMGVSDIYENGHKLKILKARVSSKLNVPIILGHGLHFAEKLMKESETSDDEANSRSELSLKGMECRWDLIRVPDPNTEVISLLVDSTNPENDAKAFSQVMNVLERVFGDIKRRTPISVEKLKLKSTFSHLSREVLLRFNHQKPLTTIWKMLMTNIGKYYLKRSSFGTRYLKNLVDASDTLVIDGRINTVVAGTEKQRRILIEELNKLEGQGLIVFGFHTNETSVMSCYVRNMKDDHIHFVDGAGGGYTKAAGMLKKKLSKQGHEQLVEA